MCDIYSTLLYCCNDAVNEYLYLNGGHNIAPFNILHPLKQMHKFELSAYAESRPNIFDLILFKSLVKALSLYVFHFFIWKYRK